MTDIKLVAIDIGGTLINDDNQIPIKNIKILRRLKSDNIKIALITARMFSSTKYISNLINADYGVFGNGNSVISLLDNKSIFSSNLSCDDVQKLIEFGKANGLYIHLSSFFYEGSDEMNYFMLKHSLLNQNYPDILKSNIVFIDDIFKYQDQLDDIINVIFVSEKNLDSICETINKQFPFLSITEYNKNLYERVIHKIINYIEIGKYNSTKATGLQILIESLGINKDEVLVIGDGINDIEMFQQFPNSGCLANGNVLAKDAANYVSSYTNNEAGVSDVIKHYIKKKVLQ